jgi:hypothetical protein
VTPFVLSFSTSRYPEQTACGKYIRKARMKTGSTYGDVTKAVEASR